MTWGFFPAIADRHPAWSLNALICYNVMKSSLIHLFVSSFVRSFIVHSFHCPWQPYTQLLTFGDERTLRVRSQNEFRAHLKWRHLASRASHLFFGLSFITRICTARKGSACRVVDLLGHGRRHGLGQSCGLCENLSPTHNLSQALTIGLSAKLSWVSSSSPTPPLIRLLRRLRNLRKTWKASSICGRCAHPTDSQLLPIPFSITTLCERSLIKRCDKVSPHYLQILETSSAQEDTSIAHFCAKRLASSLTFVYGNLGVLSIMPKIPEFSVGI